MTRSPERSQVPSARTCSLASTVWQPGHQLTGAMGPVGQAGFEQPQEDHLVPPDVGRVVAADLAPPVVDGAQGHNAGLQLGDALLGEDAGMGPGPDGGVLGRQAERVEAEGREHGIALHGPVPDQKVAEGVVPDVALVGRARSGRGTCTGRTEPGAGHRRRPGRSPRRPSAAATSARSPERRRPAPCPGILRRAGCYSCNRLLTTRRAPRGQADIVPGCPGA